MTTDSGDSDRRGDHADEPDDVTDAAAAAVVPDGPMFGLVAGINGGAGDGIRVRLELLWGRRGRRSRGPKPKLSVAKIVETAIGIADADGLEAVSMRRVAEQLGVGTMSLYRYVPAKDALVDVMFDTVIGQETPPVDVPGSWRDKLEHIMRTDWALYHRHPWVLQALVNRPPMGPSVLASFDATLEAISGIGLSGKEMLAVVSLIDAYVRGVARQSLDAAQTERTTGVSDAEWWSVTGPALDEVVGDYSDYPAVMRVYSDGGFDPPEEGDTPDFLSFEFGLRRVLDGIAALVESRAASADPPTDACP